MCIRQDIESLISSNLSAYRIGKDLNIPSSIIKKLRLGTAKVDNITLVKAEILSSYYQKLKKEGEL